MCNPETLDLMSFEELDEFHDQFEEIGYWQLAPYLFPDRHEGYKTDTKLLGEYARLRLLTLHPDIDPSLNPLYMEELESHYNTFPRRLKWRPSQRDQLLKRRRNLLKMTKEELDEFSEMKLLKASAYLFPDRPPGYRDATIVLQQLAIALLAGRDDLIEAYEERLPDYAKIR